MRNPAIPAGLLCALLAGAATAQEDTAAGTPPEEPAAPVLRRVVASSSSLRLANISTRHSSTTLVVKVIFTFRLTRAARIG